MTPACTVEPRDSEEHLRIEQPVASIKVRFFIRPHGDHFFACCIDLNLAAEGPTPQEAQSKLSEAICSHLATAIHEDGIGQGFRRRPAPLGLKVEYWYWSLLDRLRTTSKDKPPMVQTLRLAAVKGA